MEQRSNTFCRICEAACGLTVSTKDNQITEIKPNNDHVVSEGYACVKGLSLQEFVHSPDRLTQPLKKINGKFRPISWDQAIKEIAHKLNIIREQHGPQSLAGYIGNPIGFSLWPNIMLQGFLQGFGSDKLFTVSTVDCSNKYAVAEKMYGSYLRQTLPDIDHSQLFIGIGTNPAISKMSFINMPNAMKRLQAIEERSGKVVWINPRKTESAKRFGQHIAIRPDTDVYFLLGFLHQLIKLDAINHHNIEQYMQGFDEIVELAKQWPLDKVSQVTRISEEVIKQLVNDYIQADSAVIYSSTGINQGRFGSLAFWIQEVINAVSGNLDKRGGSLMGKPSIHIPDVTEEKYSRINNIPYINAGIPTGILADEILTPGEGQVRALFVMAGNPVLSCSNSERLQKAFDDLELMVSLDIFHNETANHADYILPGLHFLERPDIPFMFFSGMGLMPKRYFDYTDAVLTPPGEALDESLIYRQIASEANMPLFSSKIFQKVLDMGDKLSPYFKNNTQERIYGLMGFMAKAGGLKKLRRKTNGQLLTDNQPGDYFGERIKKHKTSIQLAPKEFIERAVTLHNHYKADIKDTRLRLISKRERFSHNSWAHNVKKFVKGERNQNYLYIHPQDAQQRHLNNGDTARVSANGKHIDIIVKYDEDFSLGCVSIPHGWGHQQSKLSIANKTAGVNVNIIAADGPESVEPVSGMSQLNGIPVEVESLQASS